MKFIYIMAIILLWVNVILTYDSVKGIVAVLLTLLIIRLYKNKKIVKNSHKKRDL
ncbi:MULTISPECIES: hypothetical protein [Staphylococcus]|nr:MULTISPECIES: hypothetical protein [Staphylococcus]MEB7788070.1 hypothetical protein [Staphylococcus equorum]MEB7847713.1 hypothetical protein [Staphylococcus equorum]MEB8173446.1 hypothetical protein [Staphylococcus equorum]QQB60549.1 hypothetical protein I6I25_04530 [Staphylococcus equorum]